MTVRGKTPLFIGATLAVCLIALAPGVVRAQNSLEKSSQPSDTSGARKSRKAVSPLGKFSNAQIENQRVLDARLEKRFEIKKLFSDRGITYPAAEVFLRIFKRERILELWVRAEQGTQFKLLKEYSICALAGQVGPKRTRGDGQTPEGFYYIDDFNPSSDFHLSLHLDYPNRADRLLWNSDDPGGQIYIHGGCKTEGCLAVTDDAIKELYWVSVEARNAGQTRIPVHIFPARLSDPALDQLLKLYDDQPDLKRFWANLKTGFDAFESSHILPHFEIAQNGRYRVKQEPLGSPVIVAPVASDRALPKKTAGGSRP